jgi:hypothetical protein
MESECVTIQYLKKLSSLDDPNDLQTVAASTLKIISDVREFRMTEIDVEYLHQLVDSIIKEGHDILLSHLREGSADCEICAALAARLRTQLI